MCMCVPFRDGCTYRERRGGGRVRGQGERARGGERGRRGQWEGEQGRRGQRKWGRDFVQNGFVCI